MSKIIQFPLNKKRKENNERMERIRKSLDNINRLMQQLKEIGGQNDDKEEKLHPDN
jgi:hypothetical protein